MGLREKDQQMIAIGAAIAAGCRPCTDFHIRAARAVGAQKVDIRHAIDQALDARRSAADHMARLAERLLGEIPEADGHTGPEPAFLDELISTSAALAVNCGADLAAHVSRARAQGATEGQIRTTFEIARMVKAMAASRVEAAAGRSTPEVGVVARDHECDARSLQTRECSGAGGETTTR
jgi:AhpD family alkylhydroperoxidase